MTKTLLPLAGLEDVLRYDPDTGKLFWTKNVSRKAQAGKEAGAAKNNGYLAVRYKDRIYRTHRVAWYLHHRSEPPCGFEIDHVDNDTTNNKINNLRLATRAQNRCNTRRKKDGTSGYKGVYWCKERHKWRAQITKDKKVYKLGSFTDPYEAHLAYCKAAAVLHGEFANFG
jgi:hypothetical protein